MFFNNSFGREFNSPHLHHVKFTFSESRGTPRKTSSRDKQRKIHLGESRGKQRKIHLGESRGKPRKTSSRDKPHNN